jgi:glycerate 2-kinase
VGEFEHLQRSLRIFGKQRLIRNGSTVPNRRARRLCLEAMEAALRAVEPTKRLCAFLRVQHGRMVVGDLSFPLPKSIGVLSVGKASVPMIKAALSILGDYVISGILVAPKNEKSPELDRRIEVFHSAHPIPDREGLRASKRVVWLISRMGKDELLLCLISGGASAMLPAPVDGITLEDKKKITEQLIRSRASIHEINAVRRHLSKLKGGRLVEQCGAGSIISLLISDVPGNTLPDIASGLTAPDPTTFSDAVKVLKKFNLWTTAPNCVKLHLEQGLRGHVPETPKPSNPIFRKNHNFIVADNRKACEAAKKWLHSEQIHSTILTSSVDMEARSLGSLLASIAQESERFDRPLRAPSAIILGGETTVDVKGNGKGGRNQETILSAVERVADLQGVAIAALGTDGIDGNSSAAGAMADGHSMTRSIRLRLDARKFIDRNDSFRFFRKLGDNIVTGRTGTNVGDLYLLVRTK